LVRKYYYEDVSRNAKVTDNDSKGPSQGAADQAGRYMILQKAGNAVLVKKPGKQLKDHAELERPVEAFAKDMVKVGKYVKTAERGIAANLSRHVSS
jgi:hypothetical protein